MDYLFLIALFTIAFLYSSVGHGGASGYLALMALAGIAPLYMKPTALTLNLFVSAIVFIAYYKAGFFRWKLILPFLVTSIPAAFLGARMHINPATYKVILGVFLLIAVARMAFVPSAVTWASKRPAVYMALLVGGFLGFFSSLIGIGGGILLSPLLILMHWANVKESAAAAAIFIFLNSLSGLISIFQLGFVFEPHIVQWICMGVLGAVAGSYSGSFKLSADKLKYVLATILFLASIKLIVF